MRDTRRQNGAKQKTPSPSTSGSIRYSDLVGDDTMQKKKTFSTMEIVLLCVLIGSLILSYLQSRREEE
jgi:hypothetical protein